MDTHTRKMENNMRAARAVEKTETSRRGIKTETKAETIMTMSKQTTQFVTTTSDKQVRFKIYIDRNKNHNLAGDTTKQSKTRAKTGANWSHQFDVKKWQINFCLAKCLAGCTVVGF